MWELTPLLGLVVVPEQMHLEGFMLPHPMALAFKMLAVPLGM